MTHNSLCQGHGKAARKKHKNHTDNTQSDLTLCSTRAALSDLIAEEDTNAKKPPEVSGWGKYKNN